MRPELSKKAVMFRRQISPVRQIMSYANPAYFKKLGFESKEVISFAGGWVNHKTPKLMQQAYAEIINDEEKLHQSGGYSPTLGMLACKEALVKYEQHIYNLRGLHPEQIAIGANSTQMTFDIFQVLLDPHDKILLLDPAYCNFPTQITTALDVDIIRFPVVDEEKWEYIPEKKIQEFAQFIRKEKPKVVLLVAPDNPTSQVLPHAFVQAARQALEETSGFLVIDFAYKDLVFEDQLPEYFSWPPSDNYLSLHSNSKWCRGLGRRLGWIEASEEVISVFESVQSSAILCPDTLHQMALTAYLEKAIADGSLRTYLKDVNALYKKAAEKTVKAIHEHIGLPCFVPQGGLYTCMKVGRDSAVFVEEVLKATGVLFVPGWGFGRSQQEAVRISFGPLVHDLDKIDEAMKKVGEFLRRSTTKVPS